MTTGAWAVHVTTAGGGDAELAADALWQAGAAAVEERPAPGGVLLVAAMADGGAPERLAAALAGRWPAEVVAVDLDSALDAWRPWARAVTVGPVTVRPPWVPTAPAAGGERPGVELVVDPGRAFGSGSHASTRLALAGLVDADPARRSRVVDVGCGSGVLALAALALGVREAVAVDTDPAARAATEANADRAGVRSRLTIGGDVAEVDPPADLVVANILAPVLVALAPEVGRVVAPGGVVVLAGFLTDQRDAVRAAYDGLDVVAERTEDGWAALTLARP